MNASYCSLLRRYAIIDDTKTKYILTKQRVSSVFIESEWNPFDIRKCKHIRYEDRNNFMLKYLKGKAIKYRKYRDLEQIDLFTKKWWNSGPIRHRRYQSLPNLSENNDQRKYHR